MVKTNDEKIFDIAVYCFLIFVGIVIIFPLFYVISVSITPFSEVLKSGGFIIFPKKITLDAYIEIFTNRMIPQAYKITIYVTMLGTTINLMMTTLMAYPLSKRELPLIRMVLFFVVFTMLFQAPLIPKYLIAKTLGITNTLWALMLPGAINAFNLIIVKTFFESIESSLYDAAKIDGAGEMQVFVRIVLPLSLPVLATIGLYYAVFHWNNYFSPILYITNSNLYPLQVVLRQLLDNLSTMEANIERYVPTKTFKMAAVVVTSVPIIVVYPFVQKYFAKGMLLGAVKG